MTSMTYEVPNHGLLSPVSLAKNYLTTETIYKETKNFRAWRVEDLNFVWPLEVKQAAARGRATTIPPAIFILDFELGFMVRSVDLKKKPIWFWPWKVLVESRKVFVVALRVLGNVANPTRPTLHIFPGRRTHVGRRAHFIDMAASYVGRPMQIPQMMMMMTMTNLGFLVMPFLVWFRALLMIPTSTHSPFHFCFVSPRLNMKSSYSIHLLERHLFLCM